MKTRCTPYVSLLVLLAVTGMTVALERFPPPQFESDYVRPVSTAPSARGAAWDLVDTVLLLVALGAASYVVLSYRSRRAVFAVMVCCLLYFGFWRHGCVCSIGAIQNVAYALFHADYAVPISVLVFFLAPLVFTLFFGRTFCAAVCPLGAMQDMVTLWPLRMPRWLDAGLRVIAYTYLGLAVVLAATDSAFIICRYDPFVSFFRLNGNVNIIIYGLCVLLIGTFIGRPYCRFLCPYGVILRQCSRLSRWRVRITPDECIQCRLCEDSCPYGAIVKPTASWPARERDLAKRRLVWLIGLLPVLVVGGAWLGHHLGPALSRSHPFIRLAERMVQEESGQVRDTTDASTAFRASGVSLETLYDQATDLRKQFTVAGGWLGGFLGLVIGAKLLALSIYQHRTDYEAQRAGCVACARCYVYCPREHRRLKQRTEEGPASS